MAMPKYYNLEGTEVRFYHPVDAIEALELGLITLEPKAKKSAPAPVKEEPKAEEVKEEAPAVEEAVEAPAEEEVIEAPKKKAPRRRSAA